MSDVISPSSAKGDGPCRHPHSRRFLASLLLLFLLITPVAVQARTSITRSDGLPSDGITALAWDGEGLWVGTVSGLGRWESGRVRTIEMPLRDRHVGALHTEGGALWVGTISGVARYDGQTWRSWQRGEEGLRSPWVTSFATYREMLHIGTYTGGVQRWTGDRWVPVGQSGPIRVTALAVTSDSLWAGTRRGLWRWDGERWSRETIDETSVRPVVALAARGDTVWVATEEALFEGQTSGEITWDRLPLEAPPRALSATQEELFAASSDRIGRVRQATWHPLPEQPDNRGVISCLLVADDQLFAGTMGQGLWTVGTEAASPQDPLPVVLLHGLGDSNHVEQSNIRFLANWLERDGHAVRMAPSDGTRPLLENVALLRQTIADVKEETGAERLYLIGHSFGGMIARAYLARGATDVAGLITLGSPHAGVRLAYDHVVSRLEPTAAVSQRELLPEHAALLAPFLEGSETPQLHIGGNPLPDGTLFDGFPPHDGIVTAASATAAPGATRIHPLLHGWNLKTMELGLPTMLWPDDLYLNTLRPWLQSVRDGQPWRDRAEAPPLREPGFTARPLLERSLAPGETERVDVPLDGRPVTWLLQGSGVTMDLVAPDGTHHQYDRLVYGEQVAHLPYRENVLQPLDIWSTGGQGGRWEAEVTNRSETSAEVRLVLVEPQAEPLEVELEAPWVNGQENLVVQAQGIPGQTLLATLGEVRVPFREVAPGQYRAELAAPLRPGYHPLHVRGGHQERWAVVGVRSPAWQVLEAEVRRTEGESRLHLTLRGEGRPVLGLRILDGDSVAATRLVGPFRYTVYGTYTISYPLPLSETSRNVQVEWRLFNSSGAITPVTPLQTLPVTP